MRGTVGIVALAVAIGLADVEALRAQGDRFPTKPPPLGPTPRMPDGKPDLSGVWLRPGRNRAESEAELLPWALDVMRQRQAANLRDAPSVRCLPLGVSLIGPILTKFVQTPMLLVIIQEAPGGGVMQVFLDGRTHPAEAPPTWRGHAIGRWDGDTLVVDVVGFNDLGWLDSNGRPRSERLHVIHRIRRTDAGHLDIETTIDDPGTLAKPFSRRAVTNLAPGEEIQEFECNENNLSLQHIVGQ